MINNLIKSENKIIFYRWKFWEIKIDVRFENETFWMSQKMMAELFEVKENNITYHLKEIFESWELDKSSITQKIWVVQKEWNRQVKRQIDFYNLDAIIAVWYRVNSKKATQFRIWATKVLKEFIVKGFVLDDEMLKNWKKFWKDYFDELLERIRDIRTSERRFYQKLTDIYALSVDYDKNSEITKEFFATIQNKLHFAITWNTAAEIIYDRADAKKENMWLTSWKYWPEWKILKSDVVIAKNYLQEKEIKILNRLVNAYLDIAEMEALEWNIMTMADWKERMDEFLKYNRKDILKWAWKISAEIAKQKAEKEFEKYKVIQDKNYISDFDREVEKLLRKWEF